MKIKNFNLEEIGKAELKKINGGLIGTVCAIAGLALAGAATLGYYNGKKDCMPPPCK